jgi:septum site-determining protein MinD
MFAVAGGKGGAGKTTTALGVGHALARSGYDPVVVDADIDMPDLHVVAGVDREPTADRLAAGDHIRGVLQHPTAHPGVGVVTAGSPTTLPAALRHLARWHGPVLVDCPAGVGRDAARPLRASDGSLLVTTDTAEALEDTGKTAAVARELDAAPVCVFHRAGTGRGADPDVRCPVVEVPSFESDRITLQPLFQAACQRAVGLLESRCEVG